MSARESGRTFIGPVQSSSYIDGQKNSVGRLSSHRFKVYAKGMPAPLVLTYPFRIHALKARDLMASAENSFLVPTSKLFDAIVALAHDTKPVLPGIVAEAALSQQEPIDDL